jgi:hypothetical protein
VVDVKHPVVNHIRGGSHADVVRRETLITDTAMTYPVNPVMAATIAIANAGPRAESSGINSERE